MTQRFTEIFLHIPRNNTVFVLFFFFSANVSNCWFILSDSIRRLKPVRHATDFPSFYHKTILTVVKMKRAKIWHECYLWDEFIVVSQVRAAVDARVGAVAVRQVGLERLHHGGGDGRPCGAVTPRKRHKSIERLKKNLVTQKHE